jgi:predicted transcriptional regulator
MSNRSFRIPDEILDKLDAIADKNRRSSNYLVNQAVLRFIEDQEEEEQRWKDTLVAIKQVDNGDTVSGKSVMKWLDTWGKPKRKKRT